MGGAESYCEKALEPTTTHTMIGTPCNRPGLAVSAPFLFFPIFLLVCLLAQVLRRLPIYKRNGAGKVEFRMSRTEGRSDVYSFCVPKGLQFSHLMFKRKA